jgi:hypothetical protein
LLDHTSAKHCSPAAEALRRHLALAAAVGWRPERGETSDYSH